MLPNAILINVGHSLYSSEYMSVCEERGLPIPKSEAEVPPLADPTVHIALVSRMLGRCEEGWKREGFIGSLEANLGIAECVKDAEIVNFLWALLMSCAGHGVSIADDNDWAEKLDTHYRCQFDRSPCSLEFIEYRELAERNMPVCADCGGEVSPSEKRCPTCGLEFTHYYPAGVRSSGASLPEFIKQCADEVKEWPAHRRANYYNSYPEGE